MTDNKVAIYCDLKYHITSLIRNLTKAVNRKFEVDSQSIQHTLDVLDVIKYIKSSGLLSKITKISSSELSKLLLDKGFSIDPINGALAKSIKYLTTSHDDEYEGYKKQLSDIKNTDTTEYILDRYEKLRSMLQPVYDHNPHSILESELLSSPHVALLKRDNKLRISERGVPYNSSIQLFYQDGYVETRQIGSDVLKTIQIETSSHGRPVGFSSDKYKYGIIQTNKDRYLAVDNSRNYEKYVVKLDEDEEVSNGWSENHETVKINNSDIETSSMVKSRVAIPWKIK
jgi:hypothetical protein